MVNLELERVDSVNSRTTRAIARRKKFQRIKSEIGDKKENFTNKFLIESRAVSLLKAGVEDFKNCF